MDILISDNWLREFLKTKATPEEIAKYVSLCGPSVEKISKAGKDTVYSIEVTTNRVDSASHFGIAKEAQVILPRFGIKTQIKLPKIKSSQKLAQKVKYLKTKVDPNLCPRFTAILLKNIKVGQSPKWIRQRLEAVGVRSINNIVDISNYLMLETGYPNHTFDYDKIKKKTMILRASRRGEKITTLDEKDYTLRGGDIVIEDGAKRLVDLAGIMGGQNSQIDENTKKILLFVQVYNPKNIRQTSMALATRTQASAIFEKGLDSHGVENAIRRGIDLFTLICKAKPEDRILDIYSNPPKPRSLTVEKQFIEDRLGIKIETKEVHEILTSLGFKIKLQKDNIIITVPTSRLSDIEIPEDIAEEVARIYGYHNLPSILPEGQIPDKLEDTPFEFEEKIKNILKGFGGVEVYTHSFVSKDMVVANALKLKNPLGESSEYLRNSLKPSLVKAVRENSHEQNPFHFFEIANIYIPSKNDLPAEIMMLAGVTKDFSYRKAKGIVEALFESLKIHTKIDALGTFTKLLPNLYYYEFSVETLKQNTPLYKKFIPVPQYPPQIEDITLILPEKTPVGKVVDEVAKHKLISQVTLKDTFKNTITLRLAYQNPEKTLTNKEVERVRSQITASLLQKFNIQVK